MTFLSRRQLLVAMPLIAGACASTDRADAVMRGAVEARDSRLMAGIHFDVDNQEGFALGRQVGEAIVATHHLVALRS